MRTLVWTIALIIVVGAGVYLWQHAASTNTNVTVTETPTTTGTVPGATSTPEGQPSSVTVTYDGSSFSPATVTIHQGDTVHFVTTGQQMWLASDPHPVHSGYDGTSRQEHCAAGYAGAKPFDECGRGTSFDFTFDKTGTWGYHDHMNDGAHGTVIVQ